MEIINKTVILENISETVEKYFTEDTLLFDIECTGLSSKTAFIYLIGCARKTNNTVEYTQFFANGYEDEKELLNAFNNYLESFNNIMGYNSTRFDEPFLIDRFKKYAIENKIASKNHRDLYLCTTKAKVLLDLPNYKQKSIEVFLGLNREDKYNGGELIPVYENYVDTKNQESKDLVLLHNQEDVEGMVHILDILSYSDLFTSHITDISTTSDEEFMCLSMLTDIHLPREISKHRDYGMYIVKDNKVLVSLKKYKGLLYTYLNDYKNYYYLIDEDIIVPKVIGSSVDKTKRRNATKSDCKVSQDAEYVMVPEGIKFSDQIRIFKANYDSRVQYISINDLSDEVIEHIFKFMLKH